MAKAWKAPKPSKNLELRVSKRAIAAYRDFTGSLHASRPDWDITRILEEAVSAGPPMHVVTDADHPESLTHVHLLLHDGVERFALVRDRVLVTLLTPAMVARNFRNSWVHATDNDAAPPVLEESATPVASSRSDAAPTVLEESATPWPPPGFQVDTGDMTLQPIATAPVERRYESPIPLELASVLVGGFGVARRSTARLARQLDAARAEVERLERELAQSRLDEERAIAAYDVAVADAIAEGRDA